MAATIALKCTGLLYCPFPAKCGYDTYIHAACKTADGIEPICRRATVEGIHRDGFAAKRFIPETALICRMSGHPKNDTPDP